MIAEQNQAENDKILINIGEFEIECFKSEFLLESPIIRNAENFPIYIRMDIQREEFNLINNFFQTEKLFFDSHDIYHLFKKLNEFIQLPYLTEKLRFFQKSQNIVSRPEFRSLNNLYELIFLLNERNGIEEIIHISIEIIKYVGIDIFVRTIFYAILSNPRLTINYIAILRNLPEETNSMPLFIDYFVSKYGEILKHQFFNEAFYILHLFIDHGFVEKEKILKYLSEQCPLLLIDLFCSDPSRIPHSNSQSNFFYENLSSLSDNNWKLHKKLVEAGVNPNPIATAIRNDDIDTLKSFSINPYFDPNMVLDKSIYERTTISSKNISLLEYAYFYNSKECADFLLEKGAQAQNHSYKYIISNPRMSIQGYNPNKYKDFLQYAIYYHNVEAIVAILCEEEENILQLMEQIELMIQFCEFEGVFYFLLNFPVNINNLVELIRVAKDNCNEPLAAIIQFIVEMREDI